MKRKWTGFGKQNRRGRIGLCMGLVLLFCCLGFAPALADVLELPSALTQIADEAFMNDTSITSVVIPDGTTSIGARAFAGCGNLANVQIPDSVTFISEGAFEGCEGLTILCRNKSFAETYAYDNEIDYEHYLNLDIPEGLKYTTYDDYVAITGYDGVENNIIIPDRINGIPVTHISSSAFEGNSTIHQIGLPMYLTYIGVSAFYSCKNLEGIVVPASVTTIDRYAFENCSGLESAVILGAVENIYSYTFAGCNSLKNVVLQEGLKTIHQFAFAYCSELESIHLPDSVTTMYEYVFKDCWKLSKVNYPLNWTTKANSDYYDYDYSPFANCDALTSIEIPEGVTSVPAKAFYYAYGLNEVKLPSTLKSIGDSAFYQCFRLKEIIIPEAVTYIGAYVFEKCTQLQTVEILGKITNLHSHTFANCSNLSKVILPEELTTIHQYAFRYCYALTNIHIPDNVNTMYEGVFDGCKQLSNVNFPKMWATTAYNGYWNNYDYSPYYNCSSLKDLIIPDGVTRIPENAFYNAQYFESIYVPDTVTTIGSGAFYGVSSNLTIYGVSGSYAETYAAENGIAFSTLSMPEYDYGDYDMTATISVISPEGIPMEGAEISVYDYDYDTLFGAGTTDENGQCVISGLQKNRTYRFICSCDPFEYEEICSSSSSESLSITFKPEGSERQYLLTVPRAHTLAIEAAAVSFDITTSGAWTVSCDADWLQLSAVSGEGNGVLEVSASENTEKFRVAVLTFATADSEWEAYIYQTGALSSRLDAPTITYPAVDNDSVYYGDITVTWEAVEFADSYVVSLRDLDTDTLLLHHQAMSDQTQVNLSSLYFDDAHSYRVAVGAVPFGKESTDATVGWCERVFAVDEYVSDEEVEFIGTVYELYDAVLVSNVQATAATYSMDAVMMANVRATAESGIDFMAAANTTVEVYHLNAEENTWEYVTAAQTDEGGQYSIKGGLIAGDDYSFVFIRDNCSFIMGAVERLTYTAQPGKNSVIDVYCFNIDLEEQIEAFRKIQGYDVTGLQQGLYAEYFAFSDKNKAFTAANKRNEGRITHVNFSWTGDEESEGYLNWKKSYYVLSAFEFEADQTRENKLFEVNYVPFKFAARYNGYIMLKGAANADTLAAYKFRLRGDDGIRFTMGLPSYETYTAADWNSRGLIENKAEIDMSSVSYLNGTVMKLNIEYYNKSTGGEANLIFEYSIDDGNTWNVVPEAWLYMGERTVSIMDSDEAAGIDYVKLMAKSTDKLKNYGDELTAKMLSDITGMSVNNAVSAYNTGNVVFGNVTITDGDAMVRFWQQKLGKKAAKAVYTAIYNEVCGVSDEATIWAEIKEQLKKEFELEFDTVYDSTKSVIDGIGTLQSLCTVLSDNALSNASIESLQKAILENIERYTVGDLKDLDKDGSTSGAGYSAFFELSGTERETLKDEAIKLDSNVNIVWKFTTKAIQLLERLWGIEDSNTNRAMFSLMYEEQGGTPDLFDASLYIADFDLGDAFYKLHNSDGSPRTYDSRSEFEVALNGLSNSSINNMAAQTLGIDLETLLYKDLLKLTLDTAYSYYKSLLK